VLAVTSTLQFGELPGKVILKKGEANMPMRCVVNVTQIKSADKGRLAEIIGTLPDNRMAHVYHKASAWSSAPRNTHILSLPSTNGEKHEDENVRRRACSALFIDLSPSQLLIFQPCRRPDQALTGTVFDGILFPARMFGGSPIPPAPLIVPKPR
jgi:hypothetical protein